MKKLTITIDDFAKLDVRVGLVLDAKAVPNSKKLIQLSVDLGTDYGNVTILAGLLAFYPDLSLLVNKKFLFLANLEPRAMAGLQSQGMFLALDADKPIPLSVSDETPIGAYVR